MLLRASNILLFAGLLLAATAHGALAASPATIHKDAADGSIDGSYSLADMRAADRAVSSEQREYYGWDDVYRDHMRQFATAQDGPSSAEHGSGGGLSRSGPSSSSSPKTTSRPSAKTAEGNAPDSPTHDSEADSPDRGSPSNGAEPVVTAAGSEPSDLHAPRASRASLVWLIVAIPLAILIAGAWGMLRARRARARRHDAMNP